MTVKASVPRSLACAAVVVFVVGFVASGCTPNPAGANSAPAAKNSTAASLAWSLDTDCAPCHTSETASREDASYQMSKNHATVECAQCHRDVEALTSVHAALTVNDTQGTKKLKETDVSDDACLACHESDHTPQATEHSTALTDSKGTTINPHDLPPTEDHSELLCADCHAMHEQKPLEETAADTCLGCHHENVYECNTCHE